MEPPSKNNSSPLVFGAVPVRVARRPLHAAAIRMREEVAKGRDFVCLITNNEELRRLNREFLGHDYATDVLSFPASDQDSLGELAISVERAREQARELGHTTEDEIQVLLLHGLLHLLGMDHETDRGQMKRAENQWRKKLGLPSALIARSSR